MPARGNSILWIDNERTVMPSKVTITEKATAANNFQLLANGAAVDLTGATVALLLTDADGTDVVTTAKTSVVTAASGKVSYSPGSTDLVASLSPFSARWKVTDSGGKVSYHPSGLRDTWEVSKE